MQQQHAHIAWAPAFAFAAALLFGISTPLAKVLLGHMSAQVLASLLYLGSGLGLTVVAVMRQHFDPGAEAPISKSDLPWLIGAVLFGGVLAPLCLFWGLSDTTAASASLLMNLESVFTLLLAWLVFREHVDGRLLVGAAAILAGAVLLSWSGPTMFNFKGAGLIATACLFWAIDNNFTRKISAADPFKLAIIKGVVAGSVNGLVALSLGNVWPSVAAASLALLLGFAAYGLGLVLFILAMRHLGAARTGAYYATAPFIGAIFAVLFLGDMPTVNLLACGLLMAIGTWLHLSENHSHAHAHDEMEHEHLHTHDAHHQHEHHGATDPRKPHSHIHRHTPLTHAHRHWPDLHHGHRH